MPRMLGWEVVILGLAAVLEAVRPRVTVLGQASELLLVGGREVEDCYGPVRLLVHHLVPEGGVLVLADAAQQPRHLVTVLSVRPLLVWASLGLLAPVSHYWTSLGGSHPSVSIIRLTCWNLF